MYSIGLVLATLLVTNLLRILVDRRDAKAQEIEQHSVTVEVD